MNTIDSGALLAADGPDGEITTVRPEFHFTPRKGWINDPLALTWRNDRYHLFFQYVPDRTSWAPNCHWGHATSTDLVSWEEGPVAVAPGEGDDGIWSGSIAVEADGSARMFYTSVNLADLGIGRVRTATPDDPDWIRWSKGDVVAEAPAGLDIVGFRDPFVFRDGEVWRMLVGTGLAGGVAAATSFSSRDLETWEYDGLAASRPGTETSPVWSGTLWECPQIFELDGRHVLVTSVWEDDVLHYVAYGVGSYTAGRFTASTWGRLTYGSSYYAPSFFRDAEGRPGLIFWMRGVLDEQRQSASALSIPHLLRLHGDRLVSEPHPDLLAYDRGPESEGEALKGEGAALIDWLAEPGARLTLAEGDGRTLTLSGTSTGVSIEDATGTAEIPGASGRVTLIVDGPTLEIFTSAGAYGVGREATESAAITLQGAPARVTSLRRSVGDMSP